MRWLRKSALIFIILTLILIPVSQVNSQPAYAADPVVIYPPEAKTDLDKLKCVYSLIEQHRLEHNKVAALARSDWGKYETKFRTYAQASKDKLKQLLAERNRLIWNIREANDVLFKALPKDDEEAYLELHKSVFGDKEKLKLLETKATSPLLDELKALSLDKMPETLIADPTEGFTSANWNNGVAQSDPNERLTITADRVTFTGLTSDETCYFYRDAGAGHFDGNFEHLVKVYYDSAGAGSDPWVNFWALANYIGPMTGTNNFIFSFIYYADGIMYIREFYDETAYSDAGYISFDTVYFCEIERDEAVGTYGTLYNYICTGNYYDDGGSLHDTYSFALHIKDDYRYIYATQSKTGKGAAITGYMELLDLQEEGVSAPTLTTSAASNVEETTATLNGEITDTGGENADERGFDWDTDSGAPYTNDWTEEGSFGTGSFNHGVSSLTKGELYYCRAKAHNSVGWGYGSEETFLTKPDEPTGLTATDYDNSSVDFSWSKGTGAQKTMIRYKTTGYPTNTSDGTQGYFDTGESTTISSLSSGQIYYFRAWSYATEGGLEQYSDATSDTTEYTSPGDPSNLATSNPDYHSLDLTWDKGTGGDKTMVRRKEGSYPTGVSDGNQAYFDTGSSTTDSGLDPGTTYYYRAWAYDSDSGYYSDSYSQATGTTTSITAPTVVTDNATLVEETTATLNGNITDVDGENADYRGFEWDTDTGVPYSTNWTESDNFTTGAFSHGITSLTKGELYYFRAMAHNSDGWGYGGELTFLTKPDETTNLSKVSTSNTTIEISWDKGTGAQKTMVRYRTDGTYPTGLTDGTQAYLDTGTSANITNLTSGQEVKIRAWSYATEGGLEQYSDNTADLTEYTNPGDITNFDAYNPSSSTIDLLWTKGTGADKTMVRRKSGNYPSGPTDGTQVYFNTGNTTQDTELDPNVQYFYAAWGYDSDSGYYSDNAATDNETTLANTPTVVTNAASNVEEITATMNGNITDIGGENCDTRGFEWDIDTGSPYAENWTEEGSFGTGSFSHGLTSLTKGELYYGRAIAKNSVGWGYGSEITFLTKPDEPTGLGEIGTSTTWINMEWVKGGGAQKTLVRYKTGSYPSGISDGTEAYFDTGTSVNVTSLDPNITYYFRAWSYATEGGLEQYSDLTSDDTASTQVGAPSVSNDGATNVTNDDARLNGTIDDTGGENPTVTVFWGESDGGTNPASWSDNASLGAKGAGAFYHGLTDLDAETLYYFTFRAVNNGGTDWSSTDNFTTSSVPPSVSAGAAVAGGLVSEQDYDMAIMALIPLVLLMGLASWQKYPMLFIITAASSVGIGLIVNDFYDSAYGLALGMSLIAYAFFNLGMAYKYMFVAKEGRDETDYG